MALKVVLKGLEKLPQAIERERRRVHRATVKGVKEETAAVKERTRAVVRRAFPRRGFRVATIVRGDVFDEGLGRPVRGRVRSAWRKLGGRDPIAARIFGGVIKARAGGWLTLRAKRGPANIRIARETMKTYWLRRRPGVVLLIGRGKTGRARPRLLFTLVKRLVVRRRTTPRALLGRAARALPERIRRHYRTGV